MYPLLIPIRRLRDAASLALLLAAPGFALDVLVVDDSGGQGVDHTQIFSAVAAASPGDTILVRTGFYVAFTIDGKSLTVTADDGAFVGIQGTVRVENLGALDSVLLRGLQAQQITTSEALSIHDCVGPVWVEDSRFFGPSLPTASGNSNAAHVTSSRSVSFQRCELGGARAIADSIEAGSGILAADSRIFLFDSNLTGGTGAVSIDNVPFAAGSGATVEGGSFYASGCTIQGGDGGAGFALICVDAGDGADGLVLRGTAPFAQLLDTTVAGGAAGTPFPPCAEGAAGNPQDIQSGSVLEQPQGARSTQGSGVVQAGGTLTLSFDGEAGDIVLLLVSGSQRPVFFPSFQFNRFLVLGGPRLPAQSSLDTFFVGRLGANALQASFPVPNAPAGTTFFTQAMVYSATREIVFSSGQAITILGP